MGSSDVGARDFEFGSERRGGNGGALGRVAVRI